jgi:hypothetical protein
MSLVTVSSEKSLGKSLSHGESSAVVWRRRMPRGSFHQQRQAGVPYCLCRRVLEGRELPILATVVICQPVERHAIRPRGA